VLADLATAGVYPHWPLASWILVGASATIYQTVSFTTLAGGTGEHRFGMWSLGAEGDTVSLQIDSAAAAGVEAEQIVTFTGEWQYDELVATLTPDILTVSYRIASEGPSWVLKNAQVTVDHGGPRRADYRTTADGLDVPIDNRVGRRRAIIDLGEQLSGYEGYLRIQIPEGITTDDGAGYYTLGNVVGLPNSDEFPGGYQLPYSVRVFSPHRQTEYPSGAKEFMQLGERRLLWELSQGMHLTSDVRTTLEDLAAMGAHALQFFWENTRAPGVSHVDALPLPERCALVRTTGDIAVNHTMPELGVFGLSLEEAS
jgi:hypothetical protein